MSILILKRKTGETEFLTDDYGLKDHISLDDLPRTPGKHLVQDKYLVHVINKPHKLYFYFTLLDDLKEKLSIYRHDLKNCVHTLHGFYSLFSFDKQSFSEDQLEYFDCMNEEFQKLIECINDLEVEKLMKQI